MEDRIEKEKARRKAELEADELKAAVMVCSVRFILLKELLIMVFLLDLKLPKSKSTAVYWIAKSPVFVCAI